MEDKSEDGINFFDLMTALWVLVITVACIIVGLLQLIFRASYNVKNRCVCGHPRSIHAFFNGRCYHTGCDCEAYEEDR